MKRYETRDRIAGNAIYCFDTIEEAKKTVTLSLIFMRFTIMLKKKLFVEL